LINNASASKVPENVAYGCSSFNLLFNEK